MYLGLINEKLKLIRKEISGVQYGFQRVTHFLFQLFFSGWSNYKYSEPWSILVAQILQISKKNVRLHIDFSYLKHKFLMLTFVIFIYITLYNAALRTAMIPSGMYREELNLSSKILLQKNKSIFMQQLPLCINNSTVKCKKTNYIILLIVACSCYSGQKKKKKAFKLLNIDFARKRIS